VRKTQSGEVRVGVMTGKNERSDVCFDAAMELGIDLSTGSPQRSDDDERAAENRENRRR
jgi:hypothetical protein